MTTTPRNRTETGQGDVLNVERHGFPSTGRVTARSGIVASGRMEQVYIVDQPFIQVGDTLIALADVSAIEPINTSEAKWNTLVEAVAREFGVAQSALLKKNKMAYAARARFALAYIANRTGCSCPLQTAERTGCTRSLVYHAIAKCESDMTVDENYAAKVHRVMDCAL